jgi:hypothetical protein
MSANRADKVSLTLHVSYSLLFQRQLLVVGVQCAGKPLSSQSTQLSKTVVV